MPEMDGYDLARAIRQLEADNGGGHTPVIACTANAMEGEADACRAAGMDDYLAKPVELRALLDILDRWLPLTAGARSSPAERVAPPPIRIGNGTSLVLDRSTLAALAGGDKELERAILADFRQATETDAAQLTAAVESGDCGVIARMSHRMKGACRMVGALPLAAICEQMEAASRADDHVGIAVNRTPLIREIERLKDYFGSL